MKTVGLRETAESAGVLHLEVPVDQPHHHYRVYVTVQEEQANTTVGDRWPPGFLEQTAGQWIGEFRIEDEGELEERQTL